MSDTKYFVATVEKEASHDYEIKSVGLVPKQNYQSTMDQLRDSDYHIVVEHNKILRDVFHTNAIRIRLLKTANFLVEAADEAEVKEIIKKIA